MNRILLMILALGLTSPVLADDWQRAFFSHSSAYRNPDEHRRPRVIVRERYVPVPVRTWVRKPKAAPVVAGWNSDDDAVIRRDYPHCKHDRVRVVGVEAHSEEIARQRAIQQWSANVRFSDGERYMAVEHARDKRFVCSRSSVPGVGFIADIKDSVAGVVGKTADGIRCQLTAIPCSAPEGEEVK